MSDLESTEMIEQVRHMAATIGAGVVVIDHDLNFITGISDRIYVFDHGEVIAHGSAEEVQADPLVRVAYLGSEGRELTWPTRWPKRHPKTTPITESNRGYDAAADYPMRSPATYEI